MIPVVNNLKEVEVIEQPSLCHRMILDTERISGECDGVEAVKQAIYNILNTERYQYIIYSWNYGVELKICLECRWIMWRQRQREE